MDSCHNVPFLPGEGKPIKSKIDLKRDGEKIYLLGTKTYNSKKKLYRKVIFNLNENTLSIADSSEHNELIFSKFILNPNLQLRKNHKDEITISYKDKKLLKIKFNGKIEIYDIIFPISYNKTDTLTTIKFSGIKNILTFHFYSNLPGDFIVKSSIVENKRNIIAKIINERWPPYREVDRYILIKIITGYLFFSIIFFIYPQKWIVFWKNRFY